MEGQIEVTPASPCSLWEAVQTEGEACLWAPARHFQELQYKEVSHWPGRVTISGTNTTENSLGREVRDFLREK